MEGNTKPNNNRRVILIGFILALVVLNVVLITLIMRNQNTLLDEKDGLINQKEQDYETLDKATSSKLDSLTRELEMQIEEAQELGMDYEELLELKTQLENDKNALLQGRQAQNIDLAELQDKITAYEELLVRKDEELSKLRNENEILYEENTALKEDKNQIQQDLNEVKKQTEDLSAKVDQAAVLKVSSVTIHGLDKKGKERNEGNYRSKHAKSLKIYFNIADNPLAQIGKRDIYVRILQPNGTVMTLGNKFDIGDNDLYYTTKQQILFDNSQRPNVITYAPKNELVSGQYTVQIYSDEGLMGAGDFVIR